MSFAPKIASTKIDVVTRILNPVDPGSIGSLGVYWKRSCDFARDAESREDRPNQTGILREGIRRRHTLNRWNRAFVEGL